VWVTGAQNQCDQGDQFIEVEGCSRFAKSYCIRSNLLHLYTIRQGQTMIE
jgi:hypothetical protein